MSSDKTRWSKSKEIKAVLIEQKTDSSNAAGPILYYNRGKMYSYSKEGHTMVLGVSGTGKSRRATIPMTKSFINSEESFLVVDPKGEIYAHTNADLSDKYEKYIIDFRDIWHSDGYNFMKYPYELYKSADPKDNELASEIIGNLAHNLYPAKDVKDPFWDLSARSVFLGASYCLFDLAETIDQINVTNIQKLITEGDERLGANSTKLKEYITRFSNNEIVKTQLSGYVSAPKETKGSINSTFMEGISLFSKSKGRTNFLLRDEFDISNLNDKKPTAIYIIVPDESPIYYSLASIIVSQVTSRFIQYAQTQPNQTLARRLNVCIDELGNIGESLPNLPHIMSAGRSRNIRVQFVLQSMNQLSDIYKSQAETITGNISVLMAFRASNWNTLEELSKKCGTYDLERNGQIIEKTIIKPHHLGALKVGQALVIIEGKHKFITNIPDFTEMFNCTNTCKDEKKQKIIMAEYKPFNIKKVLDNLIKNDLKSAENSLRQGIQENTFDTENHSFSRSPFPDPKRKVNILGKLISIYRYKKFMKRLRKINTKRRR